MIAQAVEGLAKIFEQFSPEAKRKKKLEDLTISAQEKKLNNYLSGVLDPTDQYTLDMKKKQARNLDATYENINARTNELKNRPAKQVKPQYISPYHIDNSVPIEPELPQAAPQASLSETMLPEEQMAMEILPILQERGLV